MSNEQNPNPWSREAWSGTSPEQQPTWPHTGQASSHPSTPAQPSAATAQPSASYPQPRTAPTQNQQWASPTSAFGTPQAAQTATATQKKTGKGRTRLAGVLAVALLAAGVGGGAGFAASQLTDQGASSAATTTGESSGGTSTTVVQGDPSNPDWAAVAAAASKSVVAIDVVTSSGEGQGSGVVIDGEGHIVTNNHVVSGAQGGTVTVLLGNSSYEAKLIGTDPSTDLAVIKLVDPPSDLNVMAYGDNKSLAVGEPVMAIGNPLGLADTVTTGIVSALNRPVTTSAVTEQQQDPGFGQMTRQTSADTVVTAAIQTNAAINPGNSGGALVNTKGELVGITSSIASLSSGQGQSGNIGIGFAIGSDQVQYVADQLIANGTAQHPQLGISARDVEGTGQLGAVVAQVNQGSPAAEAGLRADDLVTAVNGEPVTSSESLVALVRSGRVGQPMDLTVVRNGSEEQVSVTPVAAGA